jgi:hypothetical protein
MPRASLRSLLFTCAFRNAFVWRVLMQTMGRPASASPLNSHCDKGCQPQGRSARAAKPDPGGLARDRPGGSALLSRGRSYPFHPRRTLTSLSPRHPVRQSVSCEASFPDMCLVKQTTFPHQPEAQHLSIRSDAASRPNTPPMGQVLHGSATTTAAVRRAIQAREESVRALAKRYGISPTTVQKWRKRQTVADERMGPSSPAQRCCPSRRRR